MFLLHPQLLWAWMWQRRLLRRGSGSPTAILHPGSPEQHQLCRFCGFSLSILFCPTVEVIMFWNVTLELGQIISTTSVPCNGLDDEGAYITDIILLSQVEHGLLIKQWSFDINWCKLLSTGCGKTPGCYQQWTKTSAKHGSSHIPITFVCSSKFCRLFSVVINLMLFKSLVVTSSLQPLKIMRFSFRKQKGTICVQVTWAPSKWKQSLIHCQKVSETSHAEFTENIFQTWFWKLLIFETSWCNKVTEVRRELLPGGHVLERSEDVAGKFQYQ